jgi:hypothetical protein
VPHLTELAFVDTETTNLDPETGHIWQLAIKTGGWDEDNHRVTVDGTYEWLVTPSPEQMSVADEESLQINRYEQVVEERKDLFKLAWTQETAKEVWSVLEGRTFVGVVPSFDAERIARMLRANGLTAPWGHRLVDVTTLGAGRMQLVPPYSSTEVSRHLGVLRNEKTAHDARVDVDWAIEMFEVVYADWTS